MTDAHAEHSKSHAHSNHLHASQKPVKKADSKKAEKLHVTCDACNANPCQCQTGCCGGACPHCTF